MRTYVHYYIHVRKEFKKSGVTTVNYCHKFGLDSLITFLVSLNEIWGSLRLQERGLNHAQLVASK